MMTPRLYFTLLLIILMEGYVVLAYELIAMRLTIPYVGSGTDTIAIIIASVLMPLAFGYQAGGQFTPRRLGDNIFRVREKLAKNVRIASVFLVVGISYIPVSIFFKTLMDMGINHRILLTSIYCAVFLVYPVYLLGQTIPLASHFFSKKRLPKVTGSILFVSTIGSFLGAVFSTVFLMSIIGVNYTAVFCLVLLGIILFLIGGKEKERNIACAVGIIVAGLLMNNQSIMQSVSIVSFNQYNVVRIFEDHEQTRYFSLNGNNSSRITIDNKAHRYVEFINNHYINHTLEDKDRAPMDILVIGAGGFTLGLNDTKNRYVYLDIDKELKPVAEEHFLKRPLGENIEFEALPARAYLSQRDETFDMIILDAYLGHGTFPEHLATRDFFLHTKSKLRPDGVLIMNFITSHMFQDSFSRNLDQTLRSVFPYVSRQIIFSYETPEIMDRYDGMDKTDDFANTLYIYHHLSDLDERPTLYTDIKNPIFWDIPSKQRE